MIALFTFSTAKVSLSLSTAVEVTEAIISHKSNNAFRV